MEDGTNVQKRFFQELKTKLPANLSLANIVADELCISIDSAYRRIRGESDLSLKEFDLLSSKFDVSTDTVLSKPGSSINFNYRAISPGNFSFESYFVSLTEEIKSLQQLGLSEIIYAALDLPMFYYFIFPKLAAFKLFFWKRNVFEFPGHDNKPFSFDLISQTDLENSHNMVKDYLSVPTVELWSEETINSTLRQINFFNEIGLFSTKQDIVDILDDLKGVLEHIQKQAELGYKFYPGKNPLVNGERDNFKIYHNEISLSGNVVLLKLKNFNVVHLGHNVLNILTTSDEAFFNDSLHFIEKVIKNSTLISVSAEKERKRFFNILYHKIDALIANL
jgi:hypothetical protein